jgi:hypothetical protein
MTNTDRAFVSAHNPCEGNALVLLKKQGGGRGMMGRSKTIHNNNIT